MELQGAFGCCVWSESHSNRLLPFDYILRSKFCPQKDERKKRTGCWRGGKAGRETGMWKVERRVGRRSTIVINQRMNE